MNLSERLAVARGEAPPVSTDVSAPAESASTPSKPASAPPARPAAAPAAVPAAVDEVPTADPLEPLKERASVALFARLGARLNDPTLTDEKLHGYVREELSQVIAEEKVPLTSEA